MLLRRCIWVAHTPQAGRTAFSGPPRGKEDAMISGDRIVKIWAKYGHFYLQGLGNTLWVTLLAVSLGVVLGLLVAASGILIYKKQ